MHEKRSKPYKPHEIAQHVAALFRIVPHTDLGPVHIALEHATAVLLAAEPWPIDITNPDEGIPYALMVARKDHPEEVLAAASLLRMCLRAVERGATTENERVFIPLLLSALAGYVPDRNTRAARNKRPSRSKGDALDRGLDDALNAEPFGTWADLATWLEGGGIVTTWGVDDLSFTDGETEKTISTLTFQNRIAKARKRRK
jgi:hypothetical protein